MEYNTDLTVVPTAKWKLQVLRLIQFLGFLSLSLGGAELNGFIQILPKGWGPWLVTLGPTLLASKPLLQILGDWLDNGKPDNSFKLQSMILPFFLVIAPMFSIVLVSCTTLPRITADNCYLMTKVKDGKSYTAGPCLTEEFKIRGYRIVWVNERGITCRADYDKVTGRITIKYQDITGSWAVYDSKSGMSLGNPPEDIKAAAADEVILSTPPANSVQCHAASVTPTK